MVKETTCYKNIKFFSKHGRSCTHTSSVVEESYMNEKFNRSLFPKVSQNLEHKEAQLRGELQTEELLMTSMMESFQETSKGERQAVISAQELAAGLQMKCHREQQPFFVEDEVKRLVKEVAEQSAKRTPGRNFFALLICCSTTTRNGLFATLHADRKS